MSGGADAARRIALAAALLLVAPAGGALAGVFTERRAEIEAAVEKGLAYLAKAQKPDGTFPGRYGDYPGVVSLVGMAFLAKGYMPGEGEYGAVINRCVDYVTSKQQEDGVFSHTQHIYGGDMYSHCLSTLFLSEISGCVDPGRQAKIGPAVAKGLAIILRAQAVRKPASERGGWRYAPDSRDSDLSVSGWAIMALRSARLNGAPVPDAAVDAAIRYVLGMYDRHSKMFTYVPGHSGSSSLTAVAILCLELTGKHGHPVVEPGAKAILARTVDGGGEHHKSPAYANYYIAQAMFQIGGGYWERYASWMYPLCLKAQSPDGSWSVGSSAFMNGRPLRNSMGDSTYETAMSLLALSVPFRQLPIYQRDATLDGDGEGGDGGGGAP